MVLDEKIRAFSKLGEFITQLTSDPGNRIYKRALQENPWFIFPFVQKALTGTGSFLSSEKLTRWMSDYNHGSGQNKNIGLILAGNIPLVGFHDLLCVLLSGHAACLKMSHQDQVLMKFLINKLIDIEPRFAPFIKKVRVLQDVDAVIATGSDNAARYFHSHYGHLPHLIRKNRTSVAVLDGSETREMFERLSDDVFLYFGMGCRNVSKIYLPENYGPEFIAGGLTDRYGLNEHPKYRNNYIYRKSQAVIFDENLLDAGFYHIEKSEKLVSPVSVVYFSNYSNIQDMKEILDFHRDRIQVVVSSIPDLDDAVPPGKAQNPEPWDYADQTDTMEFLINL